jgi:hypothetical protein
MSVVHIITEQHMCTLLLTVIRIHFSMDPLVTVNPKLFMVIFDKRAYSVSTNPPRKQLYIYETSTLND